MKTQIAWKRRGRPPLPPDLADITSLVDQKDIAVYSVVREGSAPKNTLTRSRWPVQASPEDFQDTEWGWDEYKNVTCGLPGQILNRVESGVQGPRGSGL